MNYLQINTTQPTRRENAVNGKSLLRLQLKCTNELTERKREMERKGWKKHKRGTGKKENNSEITLKKILQLNIISIMNRKKVVSAPNTA